MAGAAAGGLGPDRSARLVAVEVMRDGGDHVDEGVGARRVGGAFGPLGGECGFAERDVGEGIHSPHGVGHRIERTQRQCVVDVGAARPGLAEKGLGPAARVFRLRVVGIELVGAFEPGQARIEIAA
jgi:hypothetical protein